MKRTSFALAALSLIATPALAQTAAQPAGTWQGALKIGGTELRTVVTLAGPASSLTGKLSVPQQGLKDFPLTRVERRADSLLITAVELKARFAGKFAADGRSVAGAWQQGGAELPLTLTAGGPAEAARRPQTPAAPFPYQQQEVTFPNAGAGISLAGTLTLPQGKGPFPAVVLVSGSGPQDRDETVFEHRPYLVLADYLTRRGFAVLRYDDRGTAHSGGTFAGATTADFTTDAQAALAYLRSRPEVRAKQVALIGHSEGGLIAWQAAAQPAGPDLVVTLAGPGVAGDAVLLRQQTDIGRAQGLDAATLAEVKRVNGALFDALRRVPATATPEQATAQLAAQLRELQPELTDEVARQQAAPLTKPWMRYFLTTDAAPYLQRVHCPVLALNGSLDTQVAADLNLPAIEAGLRQARNRDVTTRVLPGLNHLFQTAKTGAPTEYATIEETMAPAALQALGDWLVAHTAKGMAAR